MSFDWNLRVPLGYGSSRVSLRRIEELLEADGYQRASIRRHLALLHARGGDLGVGGRWRTCPHPVSQASRDCESFHQDQDFADGFRGPAAIDYVWVDGPDAGDAHDGVPVGGVPVQGSAEAAVFGIHANVGTPGQAGFESWHGQPVEIDGWKSATNDGRRPAPAIDPLYPLPAEHDPYPPAPPPPSGDEMRTLPEPFRAYDSRHRDGGKPMEAGELRTVVIGMTTEAYIVVTVVGVNGTDGHISINDPDGSTSIVGYSGGDRIENNGAPVVTPNGRIDVRNHVGSAHVIVDVYAVAP